MEELLQALGVIGDVLDTPGAWLRKGLTGENPFEGTFDTEKRTSGRQMLEKLFGLAPNKEGIDAGDVGGFLAELVLDPTNLIGLGFAGKAAKAGKAARVTNRAGLEATEMAADAARASNVRLAAATGKLQAGEQAKAISQAAPLKEAISPQAAERDISQLAAWYPWGSLGQFKKYLMGTPEEASKEILGLERLIPAETPSYAESFYRAAPATPFGFQHNPYKANPESAFVPMLRGDTAFFTPFPEMRGLDRYNVAAHEMTHNMARQFPGQYGRALKGTGEEVRGKFWDEYSSGMTPERKAEFVATSPALHKEEGIATLLGSLAQRGRDKGFLPLTDAVEAALRRDPKQIEKSARDFAVLTAQLEPGVLNAVDVANPYVSFLTGELTRKAKEAEQFMGAPHPNVSAMMALHPAERQAMFAGPQPIPQFSPVDEPNPQRMLAALMGYNAPMAAERPDW